MLKLKTFRIGGIHAPDNKLAAGLPIEALPLPERVSIPIQQHIGPPSRVLVGKGDKVKTGQLIARGEGFIAANIHSSVSGTVEKVDAVLTSSGYRRPAVIIKVEGDEWQEGIDLSDELITEIKHTPGEIRNKVFEMGIVGMGGASFPTHVKLTVPEGKKADVLIINGVECEPFLTDDHRLMLEKTAEIVVGARLIMNALGVKKAYIGIEANKPDAIEAMQQATAAHSDIEVVALRVRYPQGGEKQLIDAIIRRQVPSGMIPIAVGAIVNNVGTAFAVYEAVQKNKPLIERVVTVTGKSMPRNINVRARIGTPAQLLVDHAGGLPENTGKIIAGGPMMGKALSSLDVPVMKNMSGLLVLPETDSYRVPVYNCIRCARCVGVCPMGLEPVLLAQLSEKGMFEKTEKEKIMDCIECGSCHYTCPAGRPLLDFLQLGKAQTGLLIRNRAKK